MRRIFTTFSQKWPEYLLEIVVIVAGIYGAFALESWQENRLNNEKEKLLLAELNKEFKENRKQLYTVVSVHQKSLNYANKIIAQFPIEINEVNLDSMSNWIGYMIYGYTFNPSQGIINSLINTSSFELISNDTLRATLVAWRDIYQDYSEEEKYAVEYILNEILPFFDNNFPFKGNLFDPRVNQKILTTVKFENLIYRRKMFLAQILNSSDKELELVENSINEIIRMSEKK
ncbi:MAG: hypothetical protein OEW67_10430 [Cyclobacteriaceae bacterium]|nr:hypothetical protein [Cyclobacteriaceae bacterium]